MIDLCVIFFFQFQNLTTCSILLHAYLTPFLITCDNVTILSVVRYHIAWKTSMQELYNKTKVMFLIGCIYMSEHLIGMGSFFIMKYLNFANGSAQCAGKNHNEMPVIGNISCGHMQVCGQSLKREIYLRYFISQNPAHGLYFKSRCCGL